MPRRFISVAVVIGVAALVTVAGEPPRAIARPVQDTKATGLKIVVVEGEDAVNIIEQRTAVAPVVEVRDRNDQPVAGAVVRFAIQGGRGTFSGARTLTVTTNAVGRAAATGLTPTGSGALQISASAAFQGQSAAVTIAQTNVLTAAQAGAAAGTGAGGSGGAAGGAGSGGGLSATTAGIVAGAAAGSVVAVRGLQSDDPTPRDFSGTFLGFLSLTFTNLTSGNSCVRTHQVNGSMSLRAVIIRDDGTLSGTADMQVAQVVTAVDCTGGPQLGNTGSPSFGTTQLTGTTASVSAQIRNTTNTSVPSGVQTLDRGLRFTGALNGNVITGTVTETFQLDSPVDRGTGTATYPVTLQ